MVIDRVLQFRFYPECWVSGASAPLPGLMVGFASEESSTPMKRGNRTPAKSAPALSPTGDGWARSGSSTAAAAAAVPGRHREPGEPVWSPEVGGVVLQPGIETLAREAGQLSAPHSTICATDNQHRSPDARLMGNSPPVHRAMRGEPYIPLPALASGCPPLQLHCLFSR